MPLLSEKQLEAFSQRLQQSSAEETTPAVEETEGLKEQDFTNFAKSREEEQKVNATPANQLENNFDEEKEGHSVPYKRFKKVIESRNALRSEIDGLKQQVEELKSTRQTDNQFSKQVQQAEDDYEEALSNLLDPSASKVKDLEKRLFEFEVAQEKVKLNNELAYIRENYPEVPEQIILQAILKDSSVDALQVAEQYSLFVSQLEEQGVAKYLEREGSSKKQPPAVPTRLGGTGGGSDRSAYGGVQKPQDFKSAKSAVIQFLKRNYNN